MRKLMLLALGFFYFTLATSQTTVTLDALRDNTLFESASGGTSNGAGTELFAGTTNNNAKRRALIKFDLSSIPAGATITAVTLTLRMDRTVTGNQNVSVHAVSADWGEGTSNANGQEGGGAAATTNDATWIHRFFNTATWSTAGGDFKAAASATVSVGGNGNYNWTSAQMVTDAQSWLNNPAANFGWIVIGNESTDRTAKRFASREHATAANRPKLSVTYTASACANPSITAFTAGDNTLCAGEQTTLSVSGTLGGATTWQLYSGSCGGTKLSAAANGSFVVTPTATTTYFVRAEGGCVTPGSCNTLAVTVTVKDDATITLPQAQYCTADVDPRPAISGKTGGVFSATPAGLSINSQSGLIDLSASTSGRTYTVRYITTGSACPDTSTLALTVTASATADLAYPMANYCPGDADPVPTVNGTIGGSFSAGNGLVIQGQSGVIDVSASAAGNYSVIYTAGNIACQAKDTFQVIIGQNKITELSATICQGERYSFGNLSLDRSGLYDLALKTMTGCDSLVVLTLTVTTLDTTISHTDLGLEVGEPTGAGSTFSWLDCSRSFMPVSGADARIFLPQEDGTFAAVIQKAGCKDTTACLRFSTTAISAPDELFLQVFPNPAGRVLNVIWNSPVSSITGSELIDVSGRRLLLLKPEGLTWSLPALPPGMYILKVYSRGQIYRTKLMMHGQ